MGKVKRGQFITPTVSIYAGFSMDKRYEVYHVNEGSDNPKIINDHGHKITINDHYSILENTIMLTSHNAIRYGDEYQCAKCGKSWDVNDKDVPDCGPSGIIPQPPISAELTVQQLLSQVEGLKSIICEYCGEDDYRLHWSPREWYIYLNIEKLRDTIETPNNMNINQQKEYGHDFKPTTAQPTATTATATTNGRLKC